MIGRKKESVSRSNFDLPLRHDFTSIFPILDFYHTFPNNILLKTLRHCFIVGHVHVIIECYPRVSLNIVCEQMGRSPDWMPDILLRADGYETEWYCKDYFFYEDTASFIAFA